MVMQTFRNNQISGMLWLVLVWLSGVGLRLMTASVPSEFSHGILQGVSFSPLWSGGGWGVMLFINAVLTNTIFIRLNQFDQTSLLPGLLSILVGLMFPGLDTALANLFLLAAFFFMLPPPGQRTGDMDVFNSGLLMGLAGLTYYPLLALLFVGPLLLGVTGIFTVRRGLVWYSAFILPWIYALFFRLLLGKEASLLTNVLDQFGAPTGLDTRVSNHWLSLGFIALSGVLGLWKYSRFSGRLKVAQRRTFTVFTLIFIVYLFSGVIFQAPPPMHFQLMATPLGLFNSFALFHEKRNRVAWVILFLWHVVAFLSAVEFSVGYSSF